MKKQVFSPVLLILSILISQLAVSSVLAAESHHVGDILYSILSEDQFRRLHGTEWELLKGQEVPTDSELREYWGDKNLPDARGVFLRSTNHGRPHDTGNPNGTLPIGKYQGDSFKSHNHSGKTGDDSPDHSHGHGWPGVHGDGGFDNGSKAGQIWNHATTTGASTRHQHKISSDGGDETRPRNITVNTFIKIRESATAQHQTQPSAEWITKLFQSAEFLSSLRESVTTIVRSML